jgi:hypothetical protein
MSEIEDLTPEAPTAEQPAGSKPKSKEKKPKEKAQKKGKDKKANKGAGGLSLATHPHASRGVRSLKGWGGLLGFGLAAYESAHANVPLGLLGLRALGAGLAGYMIAWFCGVVAWRAIVAAEVRARLEMHAEGQQAKRR